MSRSELVSARGNCRDSTMAPRSRSRAKRPIAVEPSMVARGQHRGHGREPAPAAGRASDRKASRLGSQRARRPWPGAPRAGLLSGALARTPGDGRPPREARGARVRNRPSAGVLAPPGSLAAACPKSPPAALPWRGSHRAARARRFRPRESPVVAFGPVMACANPPAPERPGTGATPLPAAHQTGPAPPSSRSMLPGTGSRYRHCRLVRQPESTLSRPLRSALVRAESLRKLP